MYLNYSIKIKTNSINEISKIRIIKTNILLNKNNNYTVIVSIVNIIYYIELL